MSLHPTVPALVSRGVQAEGRILSTSVPANYTISMFKLDF
jgi:hypothetical protein